MGEHEAERTADQACRPGERIKPDRQHDHRGDQRPQEQTGRERPHARSEPRQGQRGGGSRRHRQEAIGHREGAEWSGPVDLPSFSSFRGDALGRVSSYFSRGALGLVQ